ncbi:bifunctional UDP-N-acetylmuramoyl-tripeptide:D-alanyl-D-alanine ligase/alanine racemase [Sphingobacterium sp. DK4209]|uniref:Alanine racemase n=1 Tax=Sphingobacterium zhuxiongii TaxID=2662364 RepID=A0A5Q0QJH0_9SPHI|nr:MULTISPECIES: bifunctional UDP-N-acetylmuramoyl-tripeptide:D-alanyl-D-alanine ligase/alanine racemase [unclassified Sphingobacterium]MVZ67236.1 bifunctional UDP-N-acetylmuramoyl-tripeptide:D-alanyl-D-alanine ligase/alanine racemase [Sphingobacterium sp. DK4209]QGA28232.1 bifunctional UDP-N-acetylmuramoyl-tripeptide:D-alanyl-D-alanine ligase/alanine racemase [Sphingobacterium sp. dk4302]
MYTIDLIRDILELKSCEVANYSQQITELVYDSRKVNQPEQSLFFALTAARDGHDFVNDAYQRGVRSFVVSRSVTFLESVSDVNVLFVDDVLQALQSLAVYHRLTFQGQLVGIAGSNGKSVVKEWLFQLLSIDKKVYQSPKSYNSQLGVALSLWNLSNHYDIALIEAGISEPGEMERLQALIQPEIGVFTNIGLAHAQNFESKSAKLQEKLKLFRESKALIAASKYISPGMIPEHMELYQWGDQQSDYVCLERVELLSNSSVLQISIDQVSYTFEIPFTDKASIENILTCFTFMSYMAYAPAVIIERLKQLRQLEMRLQLKKGIGNSSLIDDSYSNDLASLQISLDFLAQQNQHSKKTLILSDMDGLASSEKLQEKLRAILSRTSISRMIWVGTAYPWLSDLNGLDVTLYHSTDDLLANLDVLAIKDETVLIKGGRTYLFEQIVQRLTLRSHGTVLEINLNALSHNLMHYRSMIPNDVKLMAMVKAFSYGSGSFEVANLLQFSKVDYLTVAFADEGVELRMGGITLPIMVLSPDSDTFQTLLQYDLEPEVYSMRFLNQFIDFLKDNNRKAYKIHVKLDTGMHRLGFLPTEVEGLIDRLNQQEEVRVQSCFTHLVASGDSKQDEYTQYQIDTYATAVAKLEQGIGYSFIKHVANTSAIVRWPQAHFDMVRLGIGLYGVDMDSDGSQLEKVSTLQTTVTQLKELPKTETVGYDRKGILTRDSRIATVKIGYADGYNRKFGYGVGKMKINNQLVPTVGTICMDMCMLDVTDIEVKEGDIVEVFPDIMQASQDIGTIPYELLVNISSRVKRVYYFE